MEFIIKSNFIIFLSLSLNACIPFPHSARLSPPVEGVFIDSGKGISGMKVRIVSPKNGNRCDGEYVETLTDEDGKFKLEAITYIQPFIVIMGHSVFEWNVCAFYKGSWSVAKSNKEYTLADSGPSGNVILMCESEKYRGKFFNFDCKVLNKRNVTHVN